MRLWIALAASLAVNLALVIVVAFLADRPSTETMTGTVENISPSAIVVNTEDGPINGLVATSDEIEPGDRVTVQVLSEPNVLIVAKQN